jgi:hypothetical protein
MEEHSTNLKNREKREEYAFVSKFGLVTKKRHTNNSGAIETLSDQ